MPLNYRTGIDIVYMPRLLKYLEDEAFLHKILTDNEYDIYNHIKLNTKKLEFLAGRYAAKEAYAKALKLGIGPVSFHDIEVLRDNNGAPYSRNNKVDISISHDHEYAIAIVIVEVKNEKLCI